MKILIVDDSKEIREALVNILRMNIADNFIIHEATDGSDALDILKVFKPNIILTDIMMPKMNGFELISQVKSQVVYKNVFITAITGLSGEDEIEKIYASGADFYIPKPFQLDDIVARLKVVTSLIKVKHEQKNKFTKRKHLFDDESIKSYYTTFSILDEESIFLLFEYFSKKNIHYNEILLKDLAVILIKIYRKMMIYGSPFEIVAEESNRYIYLSIENERLVQIANKILKARNTFLEYKTNEHTISFRIETFSIEAQPNFQEDTVLLSAEQFDDYVTDIKDALLVH